MKMTAYIIIKKGYSLVGEVDMQRSGMAGEGSHAMLSNRL